MSAATKRKATTKAAPIPETRLTEIRHGGRNFIRTGDDVLFQERKGCSLKRAKFQWADTDRGGLYYCLVVADTKLTRFVRPDAVRRVIGRKQTGER